MTLIIISMSADCVCKTTEKLAMLINSLFAL